jgi:precorrin-6B methylase 2
MLSFRRHRIAALVVCAALLSAPVAGQQTALTDGQIKAAELEIPQLVTLLNLKPGMTVADVGAGFGAWTIRFARFVGPSGRVYASDIGEKQLAWLREYAKNEGAANVTIIEGAPASTNLPPNCCDAILIRDAYHHLTEPEKIVGSMAAALKPGGRLAVIDFPPRANSEVPTGVAANRGGHGVPPEVVEREIGAVLKHVQTIPKWMPASEPASLFLVLFQK